MERSADASRRLFDLFFFVLLFLPLLLLAVTRVEAIEQRHSVQAASSVADSGEDPGARRGHGGAPVVVPPWETEEGGDDGDDGVVSDRHGHRIRFRDELVKSIKENILKSLGRTGTAAADGGGRRGSTSPGRATAGAGVDTGAEEEVSVAQVKKIIVFSDIPVLTASENGTVEFLLRRSSKPFRIDSVDLHLRISAPGASGGGGSGGGGGGHRLRHHRTRTPSLSVVHVTRPGDPFHVAAAPTGEEEEEGPLPIARTSVRVKAAAAAAWQRVPLPSSVVQEVLDSNDPVLRLAFVCDHCEVLPSSGTSQSSTTHRKRDEAGSTSSSHARKRHGHGLPYLTISTYDLAERK